MTVPGPRELGRGVVVLGGMGPPQPWNDRPRVLVGKGALEDPGPTVSTLQRAWGERQPVVVELGVDPKDLQERETYRGRCTS